MNALRTLVLAGSVAVAATLSAGIAGAAPAIPSAAALFHEDLCRLPYYQLVHRFGSVRARKIVLRCNA